MKKYSLYRYLFLIIFLIFITCDKESNPTESSIGCQDVVCKTHSNDFMIKVSVSMIPYDNQNIESISDSENYLGVLEVATDGYDPDYDILDPPNGVGNWITLYFPHPEWEHSLGDNFTQDIKGNMFLDLENRTIEWNFNVESNAYGTINLDFESVDNYCYDCIESIQVTVGGQIHTFLGSEINDFNISTFLPSNQIVSFDLIVEF